MSLPSRGSLSSFLSGESVGGKKERDPSLFYSSFLDLVCLGFSSNKSTDKIKWFFVGIFLPAMTCHDDEQNHFGPSETFFVSMYETQIGDIPRVSVEENKILA